VHIVRRACGLGYFTLNDLPQARNIVKTFKRVDVFVLNFPTQWCKNDVDRTYSFCAIVVRSTVHIVGRHKHTHVLHNILMFASCVFGQEIAL